MSNRSMNLRIANYISDAQVIEGLALQDMENGFDALAAAYFADAARVLSLVLHHCDKRSRREAQRHIERLHAKAKRIYRKSSLRPLSTITL